MSKAGHLEVTLAVKGLKAFSRALDKATISTIRFMDAAVDGGWAEPPQGYWENRLVREIKWRSIRARIGRLMARVR